MVHKKSSKREVSHTKKFKQSRTPQPPPEAMPNMNDLVHGALVSKLKQVRGKGEES